jgi:Ca2+-transporting ATPase
MAIGTLALFLYKLSLNDNIGRARTVMVLFQAFHVLNARSALAMNARHNRFLALGTLGAAGGHLLAMYLPPTQASLSIEPLDATTWARTVAVAASVILAVKVHKRLRGPTPRRRDRPRPIGVG